MSSKDVVSGEKANNNPGLCAIRGQVAVNVLLRKFICEEL